MRCDIYKDEMISAQLFGKEVLYTQGTISRDEVPEGWYCYDLCGTDRKPDKPMRLVDSAPMIRIGAVLSPHPLKRDSTLERKMERHFFTDGRTLTLAEFCREQGLLLPQDPSKYVPRPASPEEAGLFYALSPKEDAEQGAIGHVRIDFGRSGSEFHHDWFPRGPEELNTPEFKSELQEVVNDLRTSVLKGLGSMHGYCYRHAGEIDGGICCQNYGYVVETDRYLYRLRCNPTQGDYQAYLSCFDKQAQTLGLTPKGRQALQDAASPDKAHTYSWYVIEQINDPELRKGQSGSLKEAIQAYTCLDRADKRPSITKDSIAAVDLMICLNSHEWLSDDRLKLDSFKEDPVIADAVSRLQRELG